MAYNNDRGSDGTNGGNGNGDAEVMVAGGSGKEGCNMHTWSEKWNWRTSGEIMDE